MDIVDYRDMVVIVRENVAALKAQKKTLDQIKAARPTRDYDGLYGKNPRWTPAQFVEAIHKTLGKAS